MARSEFRFNKKRKHYSYLFKDIGNLRLNFVLSTKPTRIVNSKNKRNIKLFKHPDQNDLRDVYIIPYVYIDASESFGEKMVGWQFDKNDKRKIKRLKKKRFNHKKSQL